MKYFYLHGFIWSLQKSCEKTFQGMVSLVPFEMKKLRNIVIKWTAKSVNKSVSQLINTKGRSQI